LDHIFEGNWYQEARDAVALEPGVIVRPENYWDNRRFPYHLVNSGSLLTVRSLQLQARGQLEASWEVLSLGLALSRHYRAHAFPYGYLWGSRLEVSILAGIDRWAQKLNGNAAALRKALAELQQHEANIPPIADAVKMEQIGIGRAVKDPSLWIERHRYANEMPNAEVELYLTAAVLHLPWEQMRLDRVVRFYFAGLLRTATTDFPNSREAALAMVHSAGEYHLTHRWLFAEYFWQSPLNGTDAETEVRRLKHAINNSMLRSIMMGMPWFTLTPESTCQLRATKLTLALWLFQLEERRPASSLDELVPKYLQSLPIDPFSGTSFHYRLVKLTNAPHELAFIYLNALPGGDPFGSSTALHYYYDWITSPGTYILDHSTIPNGPPLVRKHVPPGTGILWSVGIDGNDDGGTKQSVLGMRIDPHAWEQEKADWIFLVPPLELKR
jgi:hypothetical protein